MKNKFKYPCLCLFAACAFFFALYFSGGGTTGPLFGHGDTAQGEFIGHFFAKNLSLFPFPRLQLKTDQIFYPYGVSAVFEPWAIEREYFFALFFSLFGTGPWLFIYYMMSLLISCLGLFLLFNKDFGPVKAALAGFCAVFLNFYALAKFPAHYEMSVLHWTTLGIAVDFLLVRQTTARGKISLRLLLLRSLFTVLALGLGLGYVAGASLFSVTICCVYVFFYLAGVWLKERKPPYTFKNLINNWQTEFINHKWPCLALLLGTVIFTFLYIPVVVQIYFATKEFTDVPQGSMWTSPWRILIPWLPWTNPAMGEPAWLKTLIADHSEGLGAGSPGFFLIISALFGILFSRRKTALVPFILMFIWIWFNHPYKHLSLNIFPWFGYARVGSRFTILMAPLLTIMALGIPFPRHRKSYPMAVLFLLLIITAILEFYTFMNGYRYRPARIPENFLNYMETVKNAPGEAVLDWPFCIAGGNGIGTPYLGRFYRRNNSVGFMQRYHGKKIVGNYFGRLSMKQVEPLLQAGWHKLFHPDHKHPFQAKRQAVPMTASEWRFFDKFYTRNDFCGINLYPDLLAPGDEKKFYQRFGRPVIGTTIANGLQAVFIAKDPTRRRRVNKKKGKKITYLPALPAGTTINFLKPRIPSEIKVSGMFSLAQSRAGIIRLAGNTTELRFWSEYNTTAKLILTGFIKKKTFLMINDRSYEITEAATKRIKFRVRKGINHIRFFSEYKKEPAIAFKKLRLKLK